jgi:hypothetical protein
MKIKTLIVALSLTIISGCAGEFRVVDKYGILADNPVKKEEISKHYTSYTVFCERGRAYMKAYNVYKETDKKVILSGNIGMYCENGNVLSGDGSYEVGKVNNPIGVYCHGGIVVDKDDVKGDKLDIDKD